MTNALIEDPPRITIKQLAVLRDVERSGGGDSWDHLKSHGHHYQTVRSVVSAGWLIEQRIKPTSRYLNIRYAITTSGRQAIIKARSL